MGVRRHDNWKERSIGTVRSLHGPRLQGLLLRLGERIRLNLRDLQDCCRVYGVDDARLDIDSPNLVNPPSTDIDLWWRPDFQKKRRG